MKKDDLLTTIGQTAVGVVTFTLGRAVALGGKVVTVGLGVLESALRGEQAFTLRDEPSAPRRGTGMASVPGTAGDDGGGFAPSAPAFEPADGITQPARRPRSVTRRSSAGAAAGVTPPPRPAKRATARSLPPSVRPVTSMRSHRATPDPTPEPDAAPAAPAAPVKAAAGASDPAPAPAVKKTAKKTATTPAKQAPAATSAAKKATAKKATAKRAVPPTAKKAVPPTAKKAAPPSPPPPEVSGSVTPVASPSAGEQADGDVTVTPTEG